MALIVVRGCVTFDAVLKGDSCAGTGPRRSECGAPLANKNERELVVLLRGQSKKLWRINSPSMRAAAIRDGDGEGCRSSISAALREPLLLVLGFTKPPFSLAASTAAKAIAAVSCMLCQQYAAEARGSARCRRWQPVPLGDEEVARTMGGVSSQRCFRDKTKENDTTSS